MVSMDSQQNRHVIRKSSDVFFAASLYKLLKNPTHLLMVSVACVTSLLCNVFIHVIFYCL